MKKIDKLLIESFMGPFVVTFVIAIFVLIMQMLWVYIDDIAGKGAGLFLLIELISYMTVSLVPMALPIAVLISSVMVMGNLAERYELSSMKSAGVSLLRVMLPLFVLTSGIAAFSFFANNTLIPISNLKFKSRLYDIRKQKPTLSIEERLFNDDFGDVIIRVEKKIGDSGDVENILIYDHSDITENRLSEISAKTGRMYTSKDGKYFIMDLENGSQYTEIKPTYTEGKPNYPFLRTNFKTWRKVFDMSEFEIEGTDENLFKSHHTMLSTRQLLTAIDSMDQVSQKRKDSYADYIDRHIPLPNQKKTSPKDTTNQRPKYKHSAKKISLPKQDIQKPLNQYHSIVELFPPKDQKKYLTRAKGLIRGLKTQSKATQSSLNNTEERRIKHIYEMHSKFSMAVACILFLFIGAPMGAIVRKGGFGYPILISIIYFILFIIFNIMFKKLAESHSISPALAAWVPNLILIPIGIFLTVKAMNDSPIIDWTKIRQSIHKFSPRQ